MTAAVGFFDGVHLGHQAILEGADAAITFANHPLTVLRPGDAPKLILPLRDKIAAIKACGVGEVVALEFTPALAAMTAEEFVRQYLSRHKVVRCGANWRFGKGGEGDAGMLARFGIRAETVPYATHSGERISSSRIRSALGAGDVASAAEMMGRTLSLTAGAKRGKGMGEALGYPTVNLDFGDFVPCLAVGVYAVRLDGKQGVANFGFAPTFGDKAWKEPVMEINLAEAPGELDASVRVDILRFIRPEKRFDSLDGLKAQIAKDREVAFA